MTSIDSALFASAYRQHDQPNTYFEQTIKKYRDSSDNHNDDNDALQASAAMPPIVEAQFRQRYVDLVRFFEEHRDAKSYATVCEWFTRLIGCANIAVKADDDGAHVKPVVLRVEKRDYVVGGDKFTTLGRIEFSDIVVQDSAIGRPSRIHAFFRRFGAHVVVFDLGSCLGIVTQARSDTSKAVEKSVPGERRPLIFGAEETAILKMGSSCTVVLNPIPCIIEGNACTGYSNFVGECKHFICCVNCAIEWRASATSDATCPVCRRKFYGPEQIEKTYFVDTIATIAATATTNNSMV